MSIKIDTRSNHIHILPDNNSGASADLAVELKSLIEQIYEQSPNNIIVDCINVSNWTAELVSELFNLQKNYYTESYSFVIGNVKSDAKMAFSQHLDDMDDLIFTPTLEEAVDIVSMDVVQRDLLKEWDDENDVV
jgi:hypothetical protein